MNNLNTVLMEGTLTRDPQREDTTAEFSMCKLVMANNRYFYGKERKWVKDSSYFYVYVYGPVAEACLRYLKKGRGIRVVGRLKQHSWKGNDGYWRERIYLIAEHIEFQPEKKTDDQPEVEQERKNGPQDTKADMPSMEELEQARLQAQDNEEETPAPTVLDNGGEESSSADNSPEAEKNGISNVDETEADPF